MAKVTIDIAEIRYGDNGNGRNTPGRLPGLYIVIENDI